ncbi:MAG: hypothetical protein ACJA2J_000413 [Candidatus Azotimanducaceae bacterium]|jgi:hypothetical protein
MVFCNAAKTGEQQEHGACSGCNGLAALAQVEVVAKDENSLSISRPAGKFEGFVFSRLAVDACHWKIDVGW